MTALGRNAWLCVGSTTRAGGSTAKLKLPSPTANCRLFSAFAYLLESFHLLVLLRAACDHQRPEQSRPWLEPYVLRRGGDVDKHNFLYDTFLDPYLTSSAREVWNGVSAQMQKHHPHVCRYILTLIDTAHLPERHHTSLAKPLSHDYLVLECGVSSHYASPEHIDVKDLLTFACSLKCPPHLVCQECE